MSKFLSDLLNAKEPLFTKSLEQLESISHKQGVDAKLVGDIHIKARNSIKALGLDPADTTGPELYHALNAKIKTHDELLAKKIGGNYNQAVQDLLPLIRDAVEKVKMPRNAWVLKKSVAKEMLRKNPPKNIMKRLGYRSVDSMLKRENLAEIYGALRFAEDGKWLNKFNEGYKHLKPSDFETRKIEIVIMPYDRWADDAEPFVHKKRHNITHLKELGVILMLPVKVKTLPGITMWALSLLVHYTNEIRLYSSFFKTKQVARNFGDIFVETLIADPDLGPVMAGNKIHWRVIQRYFGKLENESHPEIFEPHVQPEDLHWRAAEEVLYQIEPELEFWRDLDYVGLMFPTDVKDSDKAEVDRRTWRPLAFNMLDVAANYCNEVAYAGRTIYHFRESLWNEVFIRYMSQKTLKEQILKQLDNEMIAPEAI
ncbi:MAG TPA: hypothetical protein VLA77_02910 [Candidatus Saccharimonadales bacterium]|nr:hypothetical protein [Candidatus Saccharimonadales bacterium]